MRRIIYALVYCGIAGFFWGCGHDEPKGASEADTAFGDVPDAGQVPGKGRIDRGGGTTGGGNMPDSRTNYTEPGTGVQQKPNP